MNVLGLTSFFHDSAACLIQDGRVVAFAEEERFNRHKRSGVFPIESIRYCLTEGGIGPEDLDHVAYYGTLAGYLGTMLRNFVRGLPRSLKLVHTQAAYMPAHRRIASMSRLPKILASELGLDRPAFETHYVPHPLTHAASGYYPGPHEDAAILTIDAAGEGAATNVVHGQGHLVNQFDGGEVSRFPHSLAGLYASVTEFLGFTVGTDEYKVMGLSAYGEPRLRRAFDKMIRFEDGRLFLDLRYFSFHTHGNRRFASPRMEELLGPRRQKGEELTQRHEDIASSLQVTLEDLALDIARWAHKQTGARALCVAGGVALNCLMNRRLILEGPFEDVYVQPIAHDAGCAIGAAGYVYHHLLGHRERHPLPDLYLGPAYEEAECRAALNERGVGFTRMADAQLYPFVAGHLDRGHIVGWFQGRMEGGPRALGNRSLLADARRSDMKDLINTRIKNREYFRPFAPSVIAERVGDYFDERTCTPYMIVITDAKPGVAERIPAVIHADNTARTHVVEESVNPKYHRLLRAFEGLTGEAVLLNTSFNEREPIVCSPRDAVDTYLRVGIDVLVLGNLVAVREGLEGV